MRINVWDTKTNKLVFSLAAPIETAAQMQEKIRDKAQTMGWPWRVEIK